MTRVDLPEARLHLSELVDRASRGEEIEITLDGRPVARLSAPGLEPAPATTSPSAAELFRRVRQDPSNRLAPDELLGLIHEGRRR